MSDFLRIHELKVRSRIGVPKEERRKEQKLLVSVEMEMDARRMAQNDDLSLGIDYEQVAVRIRELARTERKTIERFAQDTATMILDTFGPDHVTVTVQKFPLQDAKSVSITITRP